MKKALVRGIVAGLLCVGPAAAWAAEEGHQHEHEHGAAAGNQTLKGEVVDVFCYLSHSKDALGKAHADCAKKCIEGGLPVAIKVGDQLYLATMANHEPANRALAPFAGEQVTVQGQVMEKDGQHLISIAHVEKAG